VLRRKDLPPGDAAGFSKWRTLTEQDAGAFQIPNLSFEQRLELALDADHYETAST